MKIINNLVLFYTEGFPKRFSAANTKFSFIGKGLVNDGHRVLLINKIYGSTNISDSNGCLDGLEYVSFVNRKTKIWSLICNFYKTLKLIKNEYRKDNINILYVGCGNFFLFLPLIIWAKIIGYKIGFIFEEWLTGMHFKGLYRINAFFHSHFMPNISDFVMPISEFLLSKCPSNKPCYKLPICADFYSNDLVGYTNSKESPFFLYCASVAYKKAIIFLLDSLKYCENGVLTMVLNGDETKINEIRGEISKRNLSNRVEILSKLPYDQLNTLYNQASALLIPLFQDELSDIARFSQKIAEYLSTSNVVISTSVGEIPVYFKNNVNMLIDNLITPLSYGKLMSFALDNPYICYKIGKNGYELGQSLFDYRVICKQLEQFIIDLYN